MLETIYIVFICLLALWQLLCAPFVLAGADFNLLVITYLGVLATILLSFVLAKVMAGEKIEIPKVEIYKGCGKLVGLIGVLILLQLVLSVVFTNDHVAIEDSRALVHSNVAVATGDMYSTDPITGEFIGLDTDYAVAGWPMFIAMLSRVFRLPVTVVAHTVLPPILIVLAYMSYYLLGRALFKRSRDRLIFLLVLTAINMVSYYSAGALSYSLLSCSWQCNAMAKAVLFPYAFYLFPKIFREGFNKKGILYLGMYSIAVCSCGAESILLYIIMCIGLIVSFCVQGRYLKPLRYTPVGLAVPVFYMFIHLVLR